jgi:hypothetical protein
MKRKIILATVLCLAVAALGIGAAPALAADGCTCHTDEPPTATAAHEPLVAAVNDCTTCHKGMTVPHPELVEPTLYVGRPYTAGLGTNVRGGLSRPWLPLAGVVVYIQRREPAGTVYTDVGKVKTDVRGLYVGGWGVGPAATDLVPRAISEGLAGPPVVMPAISVPTDPRPTPTMTIRLSGLTQGAVRRGHAVTVAGKVTPPDMAGQKVRLTVQKRNANHRWSSKWSGKYHPPVTRTISATGAYSWKYTPKLLGQYRVKATILNTSAYHKVVTDWRRFQVK